MCIRDSHGVVGLHDRVEELVQADGLARRVTVVEVVALQDAGHREVREKLQQLSLIHILFRRITYVRDRDESSIP